MATFDSLRKNLASRRWGSLVAAGLLSFTLFGCGGSDAPVVPPPPPPPPPPPISVAQIIATQAANPANDSATNQAAPFAVMSAAGLVPVTVNSPPVVNFSVFDNGAVKTGLTTSNVSFAIAKLVPGTNGSSDQWVSYVYRTEAGTGFGPGGVPVAPNALQATTDSKVATQLVYNADGYYTYTFATDIKDPTKTQGVVFEAGRTHRVAIQLSYTNAAGATVRSNPYFDFTIGADGKSVAVTNPASTRQVVDIKSCNSCHDKLAFHGGGRLDTQYCVMCHNPGTVDANSGNNLDMVRIIHKIHQGHGLPSVIAGGEYAIWGYGNTKHDYSEAAFPQDTRNCTKCHNGDASPAASVAFTTPQGNNWFNKPNRVACGSCHDGINFATGAGTSMSGATTGHGGVNFPQADDSKCYLCHGPAEIKAYHLTTFATPNNPAVPAGVANFTFDLASVTLNADRQPVLKFRINKDGTPVTFNANTAPDILDGFTFLTTNTTSAGRAYPVTLYVAYSVPQDGVAAPADFNVTSSVDLTKIWQSTGLAGSGATLSTRDAEGYYTATLTGTTASPITVPANAKMVTGAILGRFMQTNLPAYPYVALDYDKVGLSRAGVMKTLVASGITGNTARRVVVSNEKCNACHDKLGSNPEFHGGQRNDATTCAICHRPNQTSSGWSAGVATFIHGIHGGDKRSVPFNWHKEVGVFDATKIVYPGILKNCSACHLDNTINFGAAASAAAVPNLQLNTVGQGTYSATAISNSPYVVADGVTNYGLGFAYTVSTGVTREAADTTLVNSPIAAACLACHDTSLAINHARSAFGSFYEPRSVAKAKGPEACLTCHGAGKVLDVKVVHGQ